MIQNGNWYVSQSEFWHFFYKNKKSKYLLDFAAPRGVSREDAFCDFVNVIYLELSSFCNRRCSYCPIAEYPREQRRMKDDIFRKIVDELKRIDFRNTLSISLYNEPLADDELLKYVDFLHKELPYCYIRFNSNGDYLTRDLLDDLSSVGCREIQITMHFGYNEVYDDLKAKRKIDDFFKRIGIKFEIKSMVSRHNITVDFVYKNIRLLVVTNNWEEDGNSRGGMVEKLNCSERLYPCAAPFREVAIDIDGNMRRCCNMFVTSPADDNIMHTSVVDFFFSKTMTQLRRNLILYSPKISPCDTCNSPDYATEVDADKWNGLMKERFFADGQEK